MLKSKSKICVHFGQWKRACKSMDFHECGEDKTLAIPKCHFAYQQKAKFLEGENNRNPIIFSNNRKLLGNRDPVILSLINSLFLLIYF